MQTGCTGLQPVQVKTLGHHNSKLEQTPCKTNVPIAELQEVKLSTNPGITLVVPIQVEGVCTYAVVDTAAQVSILNNEITNKIGHAALVKEPLILKGADKTSTMLAHKMKQVSLILGNRSFKWNFVNAPIEDTVILGLDFLKTYSGVIDLKNKNEKYSVQRVIIQRKTIVPPHSLVNAKIEFSHSSNKTYIIHGPEINHKGILIPHSLVHQNDPTTKQGILCFRNESSSYIRLMRGHVVGRGEEVDPECIYPLSDNNLHVEADRCLLGNFQIELAQENNNTQTCKNSPCAPVSTHSKTLRQITKTPPHITALWKKSCEHLSSDQSKELASILTKYADVFSTDDSDLGRFSAIKHQIDTGDAKPVRQKMCRTPLGFENEEKAHLDTLLESHVIQPSSSAWASPPVLVRKKDGKVKSGIA